MQLPSDAIMSKVQLLHSSLWRNLGKFRGQNNKNIWGVPKMVVHNNPWVFPSKTDNFGVFWGYHHLRKHPYHKNHWLTRTQFYSSSSTCKKKSNWDENIVLFFDSLPLQGLNFPGFPLHLPSHPPHVESTPLTPGWVGICSMNQVGWNHNVSPTWLTSNISPSWLVGQLLLKAFSELSWFSPDVAMIHRVIQQ